MASNSNGFDDMVELPQITEKDIEENLRVRLKKEVIYVSRYFVKNWFQNASLPQLLLKKQV